MYNDGDVVEIIAKLSSTCKWSVGDLFTYANGSLVSHYKERATWHIRAALYELRVVKKGVKTMNKTIAKLFKKTDDALLVEKHLGQEFKGTHIEAISLKGKEADILECATELSREANK